MTIVSDESNFKLNYFLTKQLELENQLCSFKQKNKGVFLTNDLDTINSVLTVVPKDETIFNKSFLEPSCGQGIFLIKLIIKAYLISPDRFVIAKFIQERLYFVDIDSNMVEATKKNICELFFSLFGLKYAGSFNSYVADFTILEKLSIDADKNNLKLKQKSFNLSGNNSLFCFDKKIDFVIGNPPYISLYGRRDKKKNELQRIYYLNNYSQFPKSLKNGKINYIMLFIERGLTFLKENGCLSFIIDISFFETAYLHCRKFLVENYKIESLIYNIDSFNKVASGQIILTISNQPPKDNLVLVVDRENNQRKYIKQETWNQPDDEYKYRISYCNKIESIINKIFSHNDSTLKDLYPRKNLRTCTMLLNMEDKFTSDRPSAKVRSYPYYKGSKSLKQQYSTLNCIKFFNYDKNLQDRINDKLKEELFLKGIKNKKRVGLGEIIVYDNPKIYIRQSAKELIASYDPNPSAANNSLYIFTLRDNSTESIRFLKYLCGLINSKIYTFFAQQRRIIRYNKGKQPQIKISDLYQIFIPQDDIVKDSIVDFVDCIYATPAKSEIYKKKIDRLIYQYYGLNDSEIKTVEEAIESFLQ